MELATDTNPVPPAPRRSRRTWAFALVAGAALVTLLLAACGGSSTSSASGTTASSTTAPAATGSAAPSAAVLQAFQTCMSQHGVTLPTFTPRTTTPGQSPPSSRPPGAGAGRGAGGAGGGVSAAFANPADQTAVKACQGVLPSAFVAQMQARANQLAAFDSCMADHGVTVPKASPGTPPTTLDTSSAAYKTCSPLLPTRPQNAGSGSTTTVPAGA